MRRGLLGLLFGLWVSWSPPAFAGAGLDVEAWLAKPGVKLLAVEFYATWCKPCMAAVPKWKALHEKYRRDGLRLVVVATQDPKGGCVNPGWNPDDVICDDEGHLAQRFGATNLPAAYLWGWQGHLLSKGAHVDAVASAVHRWMLQNPRVSVEVESVSSGSRISKRSLRDAIRASLQRQDKLVVVATASEQKKLNALIRKSLSAVADERYACEVGQQVTANSLLQVSIRGKGRKRLYLNLLSAEKGCQVASAVVDWYPRKSSVSIAEGVSELTRQLEQETQYPWGVSKAGADGSGSTVGREGSTDFSALLAQARDAKARSQKVDADWKMVSEVATTAALARSARVSALAQFLGKYPADNPHAAEARRWMKLLRAGKEPASPSKGPGSAEENTLNLTWVMSRPAGVKFTKSEVTVSQYRACVAAGTCKSDTFEDGEYCNHGKSGRADHPMNCVNWFGAEMYCRWAGGRLPTEAEWFAEASNNKSRKYPWGDAAATCARAVISEGGDGCGRDSTWPVCSKASGNSVSGLCDMAGNVREWTLDWYSQKEKRSFRGGSWYGNANRARASNRRFDDPSVRFSNVGFRCVQSP